MTNKTKRMIPNIFRNLVVGEEICPVR